MMSPMYEYTPDKTYYCAKCQKIRTNIYSPCPVCDCRRIIEGIPPSPNEKIQMPKYMKVRPIFIWLLLICILWRFGSTIIWIIWLIGFVLVALYCGLTGQFFA
jgi:hypothetical protein